MKSWIQEFKDFVNRGNLVELAVAFVLAAAFGLVVKAIVEGVIMPIIAAIFGQPNFDGITIDIGDSQILIGVAITAISASWRPGRGRVVGTSSSGWPWSDWTSPNTLTAKGLNLSTQRLQSTMTMP